MARNFLLDKIEVGLVGIEDLKDYQLIIQGDMISSLQNDISNILTTFSTIFTIVGVFAALVIGGLGFITLRINNSSTKVKKQLNQLEKSKNEVDNTRANLDNMQKHLEEKMVIIDEKLDLLDKKLNSEEVKDSIEFVQNTKDILKKEEEYETVRRYLRELNRIKLKIEEFKNIAELKGIELETDLEKAILDIIEKAESLESIFYLESDLLIKDNMLEFKHSLKIESFKAKAIYNQLYNKVFRDNT